MKDSVSDRVKIRSDIMIYNYRNKWIQFNDENDKQYLIGGFYRIRGQNQHQELLDKVASIDTAAEKDKCT